MWAQVPAQTVDGTLRLPRVTDQLKAAFVEANPLRSWLSDEDLGTSDRSSTLFRFGGRTSAIEAKVGETGIGSVTDVAFTPEGSLYGVTFTSLLEVSVHLDAFARGTHPSKSRSSSSPISRITRDGWYVDDVSVAGRQSM